MAMETEDTEERTQCLEEAFACYNKTYQADYSTENFESAYYTGINAASVSLLAGNTEQSRTIASQVRSICENILQNMKNEDEPVSFWLYASLGEACLLQGDMEKAEEFYTLAAQGCSKDIRALGSMRKQARLILNAAGKDSNSLDHCFPVPSVVLFSGHIIDQPSREHKRFPIENEELVRSRIAEWLEENNGQIGFSSAACGSDILFLEEMLKRGGEINVVLPFEREPFIQTSVDVVSGGNWVERYSNVLNKANEIKVLSQYNENTLHDDLLFTNLYLYGTAQVRAERAGTDLKTLLVWDRNKAKSLAGTAALAELINEKGGSFDVVTPLKANEQAATDSDDALTIADDNGSTTSITVGPKKGFHHSFLPLLIADVKGYSRLDKREKLLFASNFMGEMAAVLNEFDDRILGRKTQGDSLFLVFKDLQACLQSARALRERTTNIDWTDFGLSSQLTMRISLDAGPCYSYTDPITTQQDFCGDYIVRAARLEPVTPPGNIYASETFVAVAKALGVKNIKFDYAGQVELPKGYGRMQAFHVK
jgi:class 3 adenylate cyclase